MNVSNFKVKAIVVQKEGKSIRHFLAWTQGKCFLCSTLRTLFVGKQLSVTQRERQTLFSAWPLVKTVWGLSAWSCSA